MLKGKLRHSLRALLSVNEEDLDRILSSFQHLKVEANTLLLSEGQTADCLYFIEEGCLRTFYLTRAGQEKTRFIACENTVITSLNSFISQQPSFEWVQALENSTVYAIQRHDFYRLQSSISSWDSFYRHLLEGAYLHQNKKMEERITLTAAERYKKLWAENPLWMNRLSNKVLASYLDIRQETLSRLKSKLRF